MIQNYNIRIEFPNGTFEDTEIGAEDMEKARRRVQYHRPDYSGWDWRGLVAFVNGAKPVEERSDVG